MSTPLDIGPIGGLQASLLVQGHVYKFNRLMEKRARKERGRSKKGEGIL